MYCDICGKDFNPDTVWDTTCLDCVEDGAYQNEVVE